MQVLLSELLKDISSCKDNYDDVLISGIVCDSRKVEPGFLFAAFVGSKVDGSVYISEVMKKGAVAVICSKDTIIKSSYYDRAAIIKVSDPRHVFAKIAARFYAKIPNNIIAVTGTNGKSSVVHFCRQLWYMLGKKAASIGTIGVFVGENDKIYDSGLTTPDAAGVHKLLFDLKEKDIDNVALEASSHGLDQCRLDGLCLKAAAFTNLSYDHLDYHKNLEEYFDAKLKLFSLVEENGYAVLNADIKQFDKIRDVCVARGLKIIDYGKKAKAVKLKTVSDTENGQRISILIFGDEYSVDINLFAYFQVENILCVISLLLACGESVEEIIACIPKLSAPVGRMEQVAVLNNGARVFVDYSHTPDALEKALLSLKKLSKNSKLWVLFGCGGDRDKGKRPKMGKIATKYADFVIVTDDNPRNEDAKSIRAQIMVAAKDAVEIGDRKKAIEYCLNSLAKEDILLIAGKGHETYQIIGDNTHHFDDREKVLEYLNSAI